MSSHVEALTCLACSEGNLAIEPQLFNVFKLVKSRELKVVSPIKDAGWLLSDKLH